MKCIKIMALLAMLASLFGCGAQSAQILDGPGMVYVDVDYRTAYANCLPFEDLRGGPYFAIAYLGSGKDGEANRQQYIDRIFGTLEQSEREAVKHFDYEGDRWYLVVPKYRELVSLKYGEETEPFAYAGEAFTVKCGNDVTVNVFSSEDINYLLQTDEAGKLENTADIVWDITDIETILSLENHEKEN